MKNRYLPFLFLALFAATDLQAQDDKLTKQVEVTRAYVPHVGQAAKLSIQPRMVDTVTLRPEIEYSIRPSAWKTGFDVPAFRPASVNATPYLRNNPFYVKAGIGYPLQSLLDFYASTNPNGKGQAGFYLNHKGSYSELRDDLGEKHNATEMQNAIGVFGTRTWRNRLHLHGEAQYENLLYHRYGAFSMDSTATEGFLPASEKERRINYNRVSGALTFGNDFTDLSLFNFRIGLNGGFTGDTNEDREGRFGFSAEIGKMYLERHGFTVKAAYNGTFGGGALDTASSHQFVAGPRYLLSTQRIRMILGADIAYTENHAWNQSRVSLLPALDFRIRIGRSNAFVPFARINGEIVNGGFDALIRENPYLAPGTTAPTGITYHFRGGIAGSVKSVFAYRIEAGYSRLNRHHLFASLYRLNDADETGQAGILVDDGSLFTVGADLDFSIRGKFFATLTGRYTHYTFNHVPQGGGLPTGEMGLRLRYSYRDLFSISAGALLIGTRYFPEVANPLSPAMWSSDIEIETNRVSAVVDVTLDAEVKLCRRLWLFVEGGNLAGCKLYPYNHYRGLGTNVLVGVKAFF